MARRRSAIAPDWWDYTTLEPDIIADAARLTPRDLQKLSRPGFQVVFYDTLEDFYLDYRKTALQPGEFVELIRVPLPQPEQQFRCYKISKRFDQDISALLGAFNIELAKGRVADVRIAYGGMAAIPKRATECEQGLRGRPWNEATIVRGREALAREFAPISDMRASATYRLLAAQNLLTKFHVETSAPAVPTRVLDLEVSYG